MTSPLAVLALGFILGALLRYASGVLAPGFGVTPHGTPQ
jgi:hypothetical protein